MASSSLNSHFARPSRRPSRCTISVYGITKMSETPEPPGPAPPTSATSRSMADDTPRRRLLVAAKTPHAAASGTHDERRRRRDASSLRPAPAIGQHFTNLPETAPTPAPADPLDQNARAVDERRAVRPRAHLAHVERSPRQTGAIEARGVARDGRVVRRPVHK